MRILAALLPLLVGGCAIADRSDKFGADFELGIGGLLSAVADIRLKALVGFSKTCACDDKRPTAVPPCWLINPTSSWLIWPTRTISTIFMVS